MDLQTDPADFYTGIGGPLEFGFSHVSIPDNTVYEEIAGGVDQLDVGGTRIHARSYVGRFNFQGPDQQKLVKQLSGGERNRVHLAKLLRSGGDSVKEPTIVADHHKGVWILAQKNFKPLNRVNIQMVCRFV